MKMHRTSFSLNWENKKAADKMKNYYGVSFSALMNMLIRSASVGGVKLPGLTENGLTPEFEDSILKAHKEGGYKEFESIDELIESAKNEN